MPTTDHPLVLDLGKVTGLSVYEEWKLIEGNENKTFDEFLEELAKLGIDITITDDVEEDNPDAVSSRGVWNALNELGLFDETTRKPWLRIPGSSSVNVHEYSLGDAMAPDPEDPDDQTEDITDWMAETDGVSDSWTLTPDPGDEWHIDNNATAARILRIVLPDDAAVGTRVRVAFSASGEATTCGDPTIVTGGVMLLGETAPASIAAVFIEFTMGKNGWLAVHHYLAATTTPPVQNNTAKIVYSGANRLATNGTTYTTTVTWTGTGGKTANLRTDIFRKFEGIAPFKGWTTSKTGSTVTHTDGQTVTLTANQTLTLYPLYTETGKSVKLGRTTTGTISATGSGSQVTTTTDLGTYTFKPASYASGFKGDAYTITIYGYLNNNNTNHSAHLYYKVDSGSWVELAAAANNSTDTQRKTVSLSGTANHTVSFKGTHTAKSGKASSDYRCYIETMTVK